MKFRNYKPVIVMQFDLQDVMNEICSKVTLS